MPNETPPNAGQPAPRPDAAGQDAAKSAAGREAARRYCQDGMRLGLGSGSTSHAFVRALGERVADGLDVVGVPTSAATRDLALSLGIRLSTLDETPELDLCVDGLDEIDPAGIMIKGGGAALLREKIVARASRRWVGVADPTKVVGRLGAFPLPIEVLPFGWVSTSRLVAELLAETGHPGAVVERRLAGAEPLRTDNGNFLLDARIGAIQDAAALATALNEIPGVVENGLFVGIAHEVVLGRPDGSAEVLAVPLA